MAANDMKQCPFCGEKILSIAIKCRYCATMLDGSVSPGTPAPPGVTPFPGGISPASGPTPGWWSMAGPLQPGTEVREYRIERMLGQGGMGEVYLAQQTTTGRRVAIKVVAPQLMLDEAVKRRFIEEARVMASLEHPGIIMLHTFFEEGGRFFLVMKYIDGESVEERVERTGPLPIDEALRISKGVLSALEYAHKRPQPVVHRDIKPANILLGKDGSVVVMDFGIAKAVGREKLTRTQGIVGTYEYMSPEQIMGDEVSPATDIYCFGITLYKMLTGVVPFPQNSEGGFECMEAHLRKPVPPIVEYREGLPDWLQGVLERALEKDPAYRYPKAAAMKAAMKKRPTPPVASAVPAKASAARNLRAQSSVHARAEEIRRDGPRTLSAEEEERRLFELVPPGRRKAAQRPASRAGAAASLSSPHTNNKKKKRAKSTYRMPADAEQLFAPIEEGNLSHLGTWGLWAAIISGVFLLFVLLFWDSDGYFAKGVRAFCLVPAGAVFLLSLVMSYVFRSEDRVEYVAALWKEVKEWCGGAAGAMSGSLADLVNWSVDALTELRDGLLGSDIDLERTSLHSLRKRKLIVACCVASSLVLALVAFFWLAGKGLIGTGFLVASALLVMGLVAASLLVRLYGQ